ncbi:MAG TPA: ornithine cyclodeaminase family protein [Caulobacteraceae bacterium]|jgi:ornithine cyclodeaminase
MELRILSGADVRRLMPMREAIELMARTMAQVSAGEAVNPLRSVTALPGGKGRLGLMPGALPDAGFGLKALSLFPDNPAAGLSSHLGLILLFEPEHGRPVAIIDAAETTAIRTAAVSGMATRLLAREAADDLAILGSGEQAASHLEAMAAVRPLNRVRVWSRIAEHAEVFAAREGERHGLRIEVMSDVEAAVRGADLICTVTAAREPILRHAWVAAGAHVNAVGASTPNAAEVDADLVREARFFVDFRPSAEAEAGEYLMAKASGVIGPDHIAGEIGEVAAGARPGRRSDQEITLFKSLGIAAEDIAVARFLLERAQTQGAGRMVEI